VPTAYPDEFRRDVVNAARASDASMASIARDFGISESCLARWLKLADRDDGLGDRPGGQRSEGSSVRPAVSSAAAASAEQQLPLPVTLNVVVRDATTADLDATAAIISADAGGTADEWRRRFAEVLHDPSRQFLVAEVDGDVVGFGQMRHVERDDAAPGEAPAGWYMSGVTVAPPFRRRGVGLALTLARLDRLVGEAVYYAAEPDNEATVRLHEGVGFIAAGQITLPGQSAVLALFRWESEGG
jgi:transposase